MKFGDRMNKYFFSSCKECLAGGYITKSHDEDDMVVSSIIDLAELYNAYYSMLYASMTPDAQREECCAKFLHVNFDLLLRRRWRPPSRKKTYQLHSCTCKRESPGPDGLMANLFKVY